MEYCPKCRGTITYDAGGRKYCATMDCATTVDEQVAQKVESKYILPLDQPEPIKGAKRNPVDYLFQALDWNFIKALGQLAKYGADKYDDKDGTINWKKSPLQRDKSPINHMVNHTTEYILGNKHPLGSPKWHLVAIAFNAMMEFFWYEKTHLESEAVAGRIDPYICIYCNNKLVNTSNTHCFTCGNKNCVGFDNEIKIKK